MVVFHSDLGYSDFQVGHDHPDYVMSQKHYLDLAMNKPRFSQVRRIVQNIGFSKKEKKKKKQKETAADREDSTEMWVERERWTLVYLLVL